MNAASAQLDHDLANGLSTPQRRIMVLVNVVGGVADMTDIGDRVFAGGKTDEAWTEFIASMPAAAVDEDRRDMVHTIERLGFGIAYTTTFPAISEADTRAWLAANDFPAGDLMCRRNGDLRPATPIVARHWHLLRKAHGRSHTGPLIDDRLRVGRLKQVPVRTFDSLLDLRVHDLRASLRPADSATALHSENGLVDELCAAAVATARADGWSYLAGMCAWLHARHRHIEVPYGGRLGKFVVHSGQFDTRAEVTDSGGSRLFVRPKNSADSGSAHAPPSR